MKSIANASAFALIFLFALSGCDVIDRTDPSTAISQGEALSSETAIEGVRASMFDRFHTENLSTFWLLGPAAQADNTYIRGSQNRFRGLNQNEIRSGVGTGPYSTLYNAINEANILISGIQEGALPEARAQRLEAEGLFIRALATHHAARIFSYEPGQTPASGPGQGFTLGVEIKTEPTLAVKDASPTPRSPVGEVYSQLESDLNQAINIFSNLPDAQRASDEFVPSEAAAEALLARVNLYERDWSDADQAATNALDLAGQQFGSSLAGPNEVRAIFNENSGNPEGIFTIDTDPIQESAGVNNALAAYTSRQWIAQVPTQDLIGLYGSSDARLDGFYGPCFDEIQGANVQGQCENINDPGFELQKYNAEQSTPYADDYVHLRVAEMVLIQAEARLNTSGVSAAIDRLNDLRQQRNASQLDPGNYNFDSAYDEILAERRRELVAEGHRYFDLKRLGRDISKAPGTGEEDVPFEDFRVLDDYPPSELQVNTELEQNPGYN
ncbi:RagB/SusD family nutrient uptake outer membrane protein [Salinibacter ruber]|uniref:RagB/SusD family nutrient uptake outer membrane protein n=1 Tax=Salinibacter ruber TaxID=146919 RepID=A0A9X2Q8A5_9BACT|nr:RagB/SusD family nutrient uptake outer membrane protein [Salinibacter ruber]MCS3658818.1 hypothetical protein [Salinibacter ruber]MCS3708622.1 hypothetical protein [Salinibacter ruber]